jgi:hypothetical protein
MGSKGKQPREPMKRRTSVIVHVVIVAVFAFIPTCATMAVLPTATRVAAPLVCPSSTDHAVVTARWGGGSRGGKSLKSDLYCMSAEGYGTIPSTGKVVLALAAIYGGIAIVLLLLLRLRALLAKRGGPAHA